MSQMNFDDPILVVDDEKYLLEMYCDILEASGYSNVIPCNDSRKVMKICGEHRVRTVLLDLQMPHIDGRTLLLDIGTRYPDIPVIIITGCREADMAVWCLKQGAVDFLTKPVPIGKMVPAVENALERWGKAAKKETRTPPESPCPAPPMFSHLPSKNWKVNDVYNYLAGVWDSGKPILLSGEYGVGKKTLLGAVLERVTNREAVHTIQVKDYFDKELAELFGKMKTTKKDILFGLIDCHLLGPLSQKKLSGWVLDKTVQRGTTETPLVRILGTTETDLRLLQQKGSFQSELAVFLYGNPIHIPPLRERIEDLQDIVKNMIDRKISASGRMPVLIPENFFDVLREYPFPGNFPELEILIDNALARTRGRYLSLKFVREYLDGKARDIGSDTNCFFHPLQTLCDTLPTLKQAEKSLIREALKRTGGNITAAAKLLGISRQALSRKIHPKK